MLPLNSTFLDYVPRISEILFTLEKVEQRSQLEIVKDLMTAGADIIRVRANPEASQDGTIALDDGVKLYSQAKEMLLSAACSVIEPKAYYSARKPNQALDYLKQVKMGQTEQGSYVITLISQVPPDLSYEPTHLFTVVEPYEREVTKELAGALSAMKLAAEEAAISGDLTPFKTAIQAGVNANLCDAVANLSKSSSNGEVDIKLSWSRNRQTPVNIPDEVRIVRDVVPVIEEAARIFRETNIYDGYRVKGAVIKLHRVTRDGPGQITVWGQIEDQQRLVTLDLSPEDYDRAIMAHREGKLVTVVGELIKEKRSFILQNPRLFSLEDEEDKLQSLFQNSSLSDK